MQRKDEILAKKAKLAELRRQREEREQKQKELSKRGTAGEASAETGPPQPYRKDREELDRIIDGIIGDGRSSSAANSPSPRRSWLSSSFDATKADDESGSKPLSKPSTVDTQSVGTQTLSTAPISVNYEFLPVAAPAKEIFSYSKAIQTSGSDLAIRRKKSRGSYPDSGSDASQSSTDSPSKLKRRSQREREREEKLRQNLRTEIEEELRAVKESAAEAASVEPKYPARPLTDEELNAVAASDDFLDFVERSSKVIERALDQDYDVLANYALENLEGADSDPDEVLGKSASKKRQRIRPVAQFYDERWNKKRMISDIDFSPKFSELILTSYTKNPSAPADPSGLLQVWNLHLHSRPEYTFHSTSDILTARFSPFHSSLLIGGSYSGQVLLWDMRSRSPYPSQKTPLTGGAQGGHTHPIYSIAIVGTQNANNIISCSTDGVVCGWTADMLSQPQEYLELTTPPPSKTEDLSPTCLAFPPADPTSFIVGTEEGTIYPCHRYDRAGAKAGTDTRLSYKGHTAPVMSLDFHPARGPIGLGELVLSSGLDWSAKLWKTRIASSTPVAAPSAISAAGSNAEVIEPLLDFSREDVVYDVKWSPLKPGVFSLVDGAGNLEVWDLNTDTEVPVSKISPEVSKRLQGGYAAKSLNKVKWEEKEGKRLATGGAAGVISVFEVGSDLSGENVRTEEWTGMKRLVSRIERGVR